MTGFPVRNAIPDILIIEYIIISLRITTYDNFYLVYSDSIKGVPNFIFVSYLTKSKSYSFLIVDLAN